MVLIVSPIQYSTTIVAVSDNGMAVKLITAVRQSYRNRTSTITTRMQPVSSADVRFLIDRSIKVAGRKIVGTISTSLSPGFMAARASSTLRVTSSILAAGCFSTISNRPTPSLMMASPIIGGDPILTSATSPRCRADPSRNETTVRARSSGVTTDVSWRTAMRWFGVSTNPPASSTTASAAALRTVSSVIW